MDGNRELLTLDNLRDRLAYNERHYSAPNSTERAMGAFASAILVKLSSDKMFQNDIEHFIETRHEELTASHGLKLLERSVWATVMEFGNTPDLTDHDSWLKQLHEITHNEEAYESVHTHLLFSDVQTNIADRYKAIKLIAGLHAERFDGPPSYLDIGSSVGQGMKLLAYNRSPETPDIAFEPMRLGKSLSDEALIAAREGSLKPAYDEELTRLANHQLEQYVPFGPMRGVDKTNVLDPRLKRWVRHNHYPHELVDGVTLPRFDTIANLDPTYSRVAMTIADITTKEGIRQLQRESDIQEYDIISCVTMLYQIKDLHVRLAMIRSLAEMVKEGGIIILQDAKKGNFETPFAYTTAIIDTSSSGMREEEILHWETARCRAAIVGRGSLKIAGVSYSFDEALAKQSADQG